MVRSSNAEPDNAGLNLPTVWPSYRGSVQLASHPHLTRWRQAWILRDASRCELSATGSMKVVCADEQVDDGDLESAEAKLVAALAAAPASCTRSVAISSLGVHLMAKADLGGALKSMTRDAGPEATSSRSPERCPARSTTRRPSGYGASWPNWRPPSWSPSPTRATRGARTRRSRTSGRTSRIPRNRPTRRTPSSAHPAKRRTPSSRPGRSSPNSAAAPRTPDIAKVVGDLNAPDPATCQVHSRPCRQRQ